MSKTHYRICPSCFTLFPLKDKYFGATFSCPFCRHPLILRDGRTGMVVMDVPKDVNHKEVA